MNDAKSRAFKFLIMLGVVNLFADLTYEGGRSVVGPLMAQLGATATMVSHRLGPWGIRGYVLRVVMGYVADRTGGRWTLTFVGYAMNTLAVPALALAGSWPAAAELVVAERTGRAIRKPVVEEMVSLTRKEVGGGLAFGLYESLDQTGATVGPPGLRWRSPTGVITGPDLQGC